MNRVTHEFMALAAAYAMAAAVAVLIPGRPRPDIEERFGTGLSRTSPSRHTDIDIIK
ncbi:hypothetical protein QF026_008463 [Streptomyces aurantiacus]|uniref:hypothetical protein n=1 Tax=Streptomyces aurantiacus TaxID=47760 RepID=UPI002794F106|nr:hypothetical protein [Streptomyces aurantiacus]MDQ0779997.1 hypothetical protein [Streptomyces aurantiacus]